MFEQFRMACFRFSIKAGPKGLLLPPYKGATFRGGFGSVFRRITCAIRQQDCHGCKLREQCPYAYIFETAPPQDTNALREWPLPVLTMGSLIVTVVFWGILGKFLW